MQGTTEPTLAERLQAKALERANIVDQIARLLWESGPQSSDWEGGAPPDWDDITAGRQRKLETDELNDTYTSYWLDTWHKAEALLALDGRQCMTLARILLDEAARKQEQHVLDLWGKVERAAGYEPGSLTGKPGVKQRVFI